MVLRTNNLSEGNHLTDAWRVVIYRPPGVSRRGPWDFNAVYPYCQLLPPPRDSMAACTPLPLLVPLQWQAHRGEPTKTETPTFAADEKVAGLHRTTHYPGGIFLPLLYGRQLSGRPCFSRTSGRGSRNRNLLALFCLWLLRGFCATG
jgi:hypothetical protein